MEVETVKTEVSFITRINTNTEDGARIMEKMPGRYSTWGCGHAGRDAGRRSVQDLAGETEKFIATSRLGTVLVDGLGNWNTPMPWVPRWWSNLMVTRHLTK